MSGPLPRILGRKVKLMLTATVSRKNAISVHFGSCVSTLLQENMV